MVVPAAQFSSPHGANSSVIASDSDCDSDMDYDPAAVESEVSSTNDEEASVDILFGARKSWAVDPKSRALAVRKLILLIKETLLTQASEHSCRSWRHNDCHRPIIHAERIGGHRCDYRSTNVD